MNNSVLQKALSLSKNYCLSLLNIVQVGLNFLTKIDAIRGPSTLALTAVVCLNNVSKAPETPVVLEEHDSLKHTTVRLCPLRSRSAVRLMIDVHDLGGRSVHDRGGRGVRDRPRDVSIVTGATQNRYRVWRGDT